MKFLFCFVVIVAKYSKEVDNSTKGNERILKVLSNCDLLVAFVIIAAKARGTHLRVHFKHCREIGHAIKGLKLSKAKSYLENVLLYKEAIPFTKYTGGIGRHAVGKQYNAPGDKVSWPQKATKTFLDLLRNIESNAEVNFCACGKKMFLC